MLHEGAPAAATDPPTVRSYLEQHLKDIPVECSSMIDQTGRQVDSANYPRNGRTQSAIDLLDQMHAKRARMREEIKRLRVENRRLKSDNDWVLRRLLTPLQREQWLQYRSMTSQAIDTA